MPVTNNKQGDGGVYSDLEYFSGWSKGFTNIKPENEIDPKSELLDAVNVDITDSGKLRTRKGLITKAYGDYSNLYSYNNTLYGVSGNFFSKYDDEFNPTYIKDNINKHEKMHYLELNDELYFSNGEQCGKINKLGAYDPWIIKSPQDAPTFIVSPGGLLKKGIYIIAYSYLFGTYETAISPIQTVEVTQDNSKISISCASSNDATDCLVYAQQGEVLYSIGYGFDLVFESTSQVSGKMVKAENLQSFPICKNLQEYKARIFGSIDEYVFFTEPFDFRQYDPLNNVFAVDNSKILSIVSYDSGLIISTEDGIYQYTGQGDDVYSLTRTKLSSARMIAGTEFEHERKTIFGFLTNEGVVVFDASGNMQNLSENTVDFSDYETGSALFRMQDGIQSVVFSLVGKGGDTSYQSKDFIQHKIV